MLRFSGSRSAAKELECLALLKSWIDAKGLKAVGPPIYGFFDPPWTPSFLRRNEVMLRLTPKVDSTLTLASRSLNGEEGYLCLPTTFTISARF